MNELIEKLKNNEKGWTFLTTEEQNCILKANKLGKIDNLKYDGDWENLGTPWHVCNFTGHNSIWRISPDYQPEPEYVDLEIKNKGRLLVVEPQEGMCHIITGPTSIHKLPSLPNFEGFWCQNLGSTTSNLGLHHIATLFRDGKTVYARLRKE